MDDDRHSREPKPSSWFSRKTVGSITPYGKGLVASSDIVTGETLVIFGGRVVDYSDVIQLPAELRRLVMQVDDDAFLLSDHDGPGDWVNHSCEPNAGFTGQITLVAMRDISVGEEISFDYAMTDGCDYDEFDCRCGAPMCRGRVQGTDWALSELWERYWGFFSPYLARRIEAARSRYHRRGNV